MTTSLLPAEFRALLKGPVRRFYLLSTLVAVGIGLILSLTVIYVSDVRHHTIMFATALLAYSAVVGLAAAPLAGSMTDRVGPTPVAIVGMSTLAGGQMALAFSHSSWALFGAITLIALGQAGYYGPTSTLMARLVPAEQRQRAFGINYMLLNFGIGVGAAISASVVNLHVPSTFQHLYTGTSIVTMIGVIVLTTLLPFGRVASSETDANKSSGSWSEVLRDRRLLRYLASAIFLVVCGYGAIDAGLSLYVTHFTKLSVSHIGVIFVCNTVTIVAAQLFVIRLIEGRSRTRVLSLVGVLWGSTWLIVSLTVHVGLGFAFALICVAVAVFAVGETFWAPVAPALVNDLAPEHLRGRYNSAQGLTWGLSGSVGPMITGLIITSRFGASWPLFVAAGAFAGGVLIGTLRPSLSAAQDGRVAPAED